MPRSAKRRGKGQKSGYASSNSPVSNNRSFSSSINPIVGDFDQDKQNAHDARQQAKDRAQSFAMNSMDKTSGFSTGQDYTGGASSIGMNGFDPSGSRGLGSSINEKYSFQAPY